MKKKVALIGAGMSGLCAGCYLQMNGYDTEIFEMHDTPGGLCTAWKRKDYTFDGCLHFLVGSSPADAFHRLWSELVDMASIEFVDPEQQFRFVSKDGEVLNLYCDPDRLERELLEKAPDDAKFIRRLVGAVRKLWAFEMPVDKAPEVMGWVDKLKMIVKVLPYLRLFFKYGKMSVAEVGRRCKTPMLREAFTHNPLFNDFAFFGLIMAMVWFGKKTAGYPIGGSLPFARRFEERYTELGGKIHYNARVKKIATEGGRAKGIVLENGEEHGVDVVISAADGRTTIYELLGGEYTGKEVEDLYGGRHKSLKPFPSLVYVSLGVNRTLEGLPHQIMFQLDDPFAVDDTLVHGTLNVTIRNFDPTLAPEGKTTVCVMFETFGFEHWKTLRDNDRETYKAEKERIADRVVDLLEEKIGDIREHVEVVDVATPATFHRYTNNWGGSYEGWLPGPGALMVTLKKELPGLKDFYLIGQWVEPGGGLPSAILSGRGVTQILCKRDGKTFTAGR